VFETGVLVATFTAALESHTTHLFDVILYSSFHVQRVLFQYRTRCVAEMAAHDMRPSLPLDEPVR